MNMLPLLVSLVFTATLPAQQGLPTDATKSAIAPQPNAVTLPPFAGRATSAADDFNRANSPSLGVDWMELAGDIEILSNECHGLINLSMMIHTGASVAAEGSSQTIDFSTNGSLVYVASVMGFASTSQNIFMKVQDNNSDGLYDRVFFYYGNNGGSFNVGTNYYFDLATPTISGTLTTRIQGDLAIMEIQNNASGALEIFQSDGVLSLTVGDEHGLGSYGPAYFDNYDLNGGGGPSLTQSGASGGVMTFDFANFGVGETIAIVYGPGVAWATVAPCGPVSLELTPMNYPPVSSLILITADGAGAAQLVQNVPAGGAGLLVQGVGVGTCGVSNSVIIP